MNEINKLKLSRKDADKVIGFMKDIDKVIGVMEFEQKHDISSEIEGLIKEREDARKKKDFKRADEIREELKKKGIELIDSKEGVRWKKIG